MPRLIPRPRLLDTDARMAKNRKRKPGEKKGQDCYYNDSVLKTSVQEIGSRWESASSHLLAAVPAEKVKQNTRIPREKKQYEAIFFPRTPTFIPFISLSLPRADQIANEAADIRSGSGNHLVFGGGAETILGVLLG